MLMTANSLETGSDGQPSAVAKDMAIIKIFADCALFPLVQFQAEALRSNPLRNLLAFAMTMLAGGRMLCVLKCNCTATLRLPQKCSARIDLSQGIPCNQRL